MPSTSLLSFVIIARSIRDNRKLVKVGERTTMNLWDSVHRGLEKASQEAARIARIQRLRSTVDTLHRQISNQQGMLIASAMETFREGRMVQGELLPICQELASLQLQLEQA